MRQWFIVSGGTIIRSVSSADTPDVASGEVALDASFYPESGIGEAPVWPRTYRNGLLTASDWTQLGDLALTADQVTAAKTYRAALRNLPATDKEPASIVWPTVPEFI
ncbi:phage tail assembly chaperone [Gluconobacter oxydans]|uniref:phage tail assembly chaperone n=1 Tax=Gluconobacter oxydans TaxID=442 RepID=UPI00079311A1|nr:phage tail assembly chaperone [Gluconobacter oxydans]KXV13939.1 hypothetical protein AD932_03365 [Gluconobacter oxydans]